MNQTQRFKVLEKEDLEKIGLLRPDENIPFYENVVKKTIGYNKTCPPKMKGILELYEEDLNMLNILEIDNVKDFIIYCLKKPRYIRHDYTVSLDDLIRMNSYHSVGNMITKLNNNGSIRRIHHTFEYRTRSFDDLVCLATTYFPEVSYLYIFNIMMSTAVYNIGSKFSEKSTQEIVNKISHFNFSTCGDIKRITTFFSAFRVYNENVYHEDFKFEKTSKLNDFSIHKYNSVKSVREMIEDLVSGEGDEIIIEIEPLNIVNFYKKIICE